MIWIFYLFCSHLKDLSDGYLGCIWNGSSSSGAKEKRRRGKGEKRLRSNILLLLLLWLNKKSLDIILKQCKFPVRLERRWSITHSWSDLMPFLSSSISSRNTSCHRTRKCCVIFPENSFACPPLSFCFVPHFMHYNNHEWMWWCTLIPPFHYF